jgi:hypothetical protein
MAGINADIAIAKSEDELELKTRTSGMTAEQAKWEKIRFDLIKSGISGLELQYRLTKINSLEMQSMSGNAIDFGKEMFKAADSAGMTADELKIAEMAMSGLDAGTVEWLNDIAKFKEASIEAGQMLKSMQKEAEHFGISAAEAAARGVESGPFGNKGMAAKLRMEEQGKLARDLTKAWQGFEAAQAGATKAQLAFINAADPVAGTMARQKALIEEGMRVTEANQTPMEKYAQTHKELSELLDAGTITQETYTRAMAKAAQEVNGMTTALQGAASGSAEALSRINAYTEGLTATAYIPAPLKLGAAAGAGSAEAEARTNAQQQTNLLGQILQQLIEQSRKTGIIMEPAGLR